MVQTSYTYNKIGTAIVQNIFTRKFIPRNSQGSKLWTIVHTIDELYTSDGEVWEMSPSFVPSKRKIPTYTY